MSASGVSFREVMTGQLTMGESDPERGYRSHAAIAVILRCVVEIRDVAAFLDDPNHLGGLSGELEIPRLGGRFDSTGGQFGLFTPTTSARSTQMTYGLAVQIDGRPHWLSGRKHVRVAAPWRLWRATTTLLTTLHAGQDDTGPVLASGILRLRFTDLLDLMGTMHATESQRWTTRFGAVVRFLDFFLGGLFATYILRRRA